MGGASAERDGRAAAPVRLRPDAAGVVFFDGFFFAVDFADDFFDGLADFFAALGDFLDAVVFACRATDPR